MQPALGREGRHGEASSSLSCRESRVLAPGSPTRPRRQKHSSRERPLRGGRSGPAGRHPLSEANSHGPWELVGFVAHPNTRGSSRQNANGRVTSIFQRTSGASWRIHSSKRDRSCNLHGCQARLNPNLSPVLGGLEPVSSHGKVPSANPTYTKFVVLATPSVFNVQWPGRKGSAWASIPSQCLTRLGTFRRRRRTRSP